MDVYYPENYYAFGNLIKSKGLRNQFKKIRKTLFDWKLWFFSYPEYYNWLSPLKISKDAAIADIGCGNGQLLYELSCTGYTNLHGFDPYLKKETSTKGLKLQRKGLYEVSGQFNLIMLNHSFEHMVNPLESMKKLSELLKPKGQLLIRVPVTDAEVWEKEGINWFQLDAPRHFFIPSQLSMRILGEKVGLKLNLVVFDSNENQFVITNLYKDGKNMKEYNSTNLINQKFIKNWKQKADILNETGKGDQACFYFKNNG
ncbi:class I SAM-dependent methyltransferase [Aquiflexum sp. LQ15W]|uniref:class I SAM-dependent methyltransferase n=1 Tax=Cognataquiflexum nitidum TaxID=2922272 RepID=UPI001F1480BC|nr:class I SAM-dependent methyltransferase [Cognataquiflexum nitidum]MCH6199813.1 class I SAM-dependent methyltransferase [Cognataquiflexum nitidum]